MRPKGCKKKGPQRDKKVAKKIKKYEFSSRASKRLLFQLVEKRRTSGDKCNGDLIYCTRTVEFASSRGDDSNKLLFVLALGLRPNFSSPKVNTPIVLMERLDPKVVAEAEMMVDLPNFDYPKANPPKERLNPKVVAETETMLEDPGFNSANVNPPFVLLERLDPKVVAEAEIMMDNPHFNSANANPPFVLLERLDPKVVAEADIMMDNPHFTALVGKLNPKVVPEPEAMEDPLDFNSSNIKPCYVRLERLSPHVEAEARAHTKQSIYKIFHQRQEEFNARNRGFSGDSSSHPHRVEVVDLVSSDEESLSASEDSDDEPLIIHEIPGTPTSAERAIDSQTCNNQLPGPKESLSASEDSDDEPLIIHEMPGTPALVERPIDSQTHNSQLPGPNSTPSDDTGAAQNESTQCLQRRKPLLKLQCNSPQSDTVPSCKSDPVVTQVLKKPDASKCKSTSVQVCNRSELHLPSVKSSSVINTQVTINKLPRDSRKGFTRRRNPHGAHVTHADASSSSNGAALPHAVMTITID